MNASPQQGRALLYLATIFAIASCDRSDTPAAPLRGPASALADLQATFGSTGAMAEARSSPVAVRLHGGRVLVAGGGDRSGHMWSSAELFDPTSGTWTPTGTLSVGRQAPAGALLPDGRVLLAGGTCEYPFPSLASAELYDPATGTWSPTGSMADQRI